MLGKLSWENKSDSRLNFSGGESGSLIISNKFGGLTSEFLEDIVDEGVHDGHGSLGDSSFWMNLLEDSVNVDGESFDSLLVSSEWSFFSWGVSSGFSWHFSFFSFSNLFMIKNPSAYK